MQQKDESNSIPAPCIQEIAQNCLMLRLRRLHRALSSLYDEPLRPYGARSGQVSLLVAIAANNGAHPADLARALSMDKSTLSRDLKLLAAKGWVESLPGEDGRSQRLRVTESGLALITAITPAWREAQKRAAALLGESGAQALFTAAERL
jgi:DNA-binding MarR family transcriptional regulator